MLLAAGCVSTEQFYQDVRLSRESAYQRWEDRKSRDQQLQTKIDGAMSLHDCLKLTLTNNKTLQRVLQEQEIAKGEQLKSYSAILPSVALTAGYIRKDEVASLGPITFGAIDNYSAGLNVTQPIFAGGSIPARINAARLFSLLADETVRNAIGDVIFQAAHGYYSVLLNQHLYDITADAVRLAKANLDTVGRKRNVGVTSDFDILRAQVELSNFQADLIKNRNAIHVAKASLIRTMGISQQSDITLSDRLDYVSVEFTMDQVVKIAYHNRPDLFSRELGIKLQVENLRMAESRYWPTVSASFDTAWSRPDPHNGTLIRWDDAWNAGINATLPLFDGLAREGEIITQKARLEQSQIDMVDAEEAALFELKRALLSIQDANEFVQSQKLNLKRATEGLRLAQVGYREGTKTQLETLDAHAALTTAMANYYQAIYTHVVAKLELYKAMGVLTTFEPTLPDNPRSENTPVQDKPQAPGSAQSPQQPQQ
jgi:outer membrane protein TolC